ncbi:plasmid mobilization protein [Yersinia rohdei]|uniref:plasmid mobilization protein n=1 Tax=Yersinia rohdei TaxID=29485 RepID=UPI0025AB0402|nr:LPD7 domain-containing protein [Yersinia rohdei]MDN0096254.1 conjugal transfer protein TraJ [Yersinia rohdei]
MADKKRTTYGTRPRNEYIKVFVTEDDRAELVERAVQAGMSQSAFLRSVGLNEPIRSVVDLQAGELLTADRANKAKAVVLDKPKAQKDGTIAYSTIDCGMVIDWKTHVQSQKATTGAALVALELASKRFEGQALIVEGTDEFRLEVAQLVMV